MTLNLGDGLFWRWFKINRLDLQTIERIHKVENKLYKALWDERQSGKVMCIGNRWEEASWGILRDQEQRLGTFWPPRTDETHKKMQFEHFKRMCYPIVGGLLQNKYSKSDSHEILWVHECDTAIFLSTKCEVNMTSGGLGALKS